MKTTHELTAFCSCPVDQKLDRYDVTIETEMVVKVEDIIDELTRLRAGKLFQEEFTAALARALGANVTTVGYHSGVKTTCKA